MKSQANYDMFYPKQKLSEGIEDDEDCDSTYNNGNELSISGRCIKISKDSNNKKHLVLALDSEQLK